jgi:hypothetical protein
MDHTMSIIVFVGGIAFILVVISIICCVVKYCPCGRSQDVVFDTAIKTPISSRDDALYEPMYE